MVNEKTLIKISKSLKTIETNFENSIKFQEKNLLAIKSEVELINSWLAELKEEKQEIKSSSGKTKPTNSKKNSTYSEADYINAYEAMIKERKNSNYLIEDNLLTKFIQNNSIASIKAFCKVNGIIVNIGTSKNKLYEKIISAITENKRF